MSSRLSSAALKRQDDDFDENDEVYETRTRSSARQYNVPAQRDTLDDVAIPRPIQRRRASNTAAHSSAAAVAAAPAATTGEHTRYDADEHIGLLALARRLPMGALLSGMVVMALLIIGITVIGSWWTVVHDDMVYGRPRTFQLDAVVGHNDSAANPTHFIFINLNRHIEVIEMPGGDAAHAKMYPGPILFGPGQDLTPVTGEIRDVNGDGKPDLIIHIQDQQLVMINTGSDFRALQPGEKVNLTP